jgi:hypothetical protein
MGSPIRNQDLLSARASARLIGHAGIRQRRVAAGARD